MGVIPKLCETDQTPIPKKIVHQRWHLKQVNFYWLIAELDREKNQAFGYANLNDDMCAEWGYISIKELIDNGAELDKSWEPCTFEEAQKRIQSKKTYITTK